MTGYEKRRNGFNLSVLNPHMKKLILLFLLVSGYNSFGQNNFQREIDENVWQPFIKYFENYQTKEFITLHDTSMIRVGIDRNRIYGRKLYESMQARGDSASLANKAKRKIEFRFYNRVANATDAFEIGLYKTTNINADGRTQDYYGKFYVLLKKINGTWKIMLDADSGEGIGRETWDSLVSR
jgi:hypothetical protein